MASAYIARRWVGPTVLYRAYDRRRRLLYVGITNDLALRKAGHRRTSAWYRRAVRWTTEEYSSRPAALIAEREAIRTERPECNMVHAVHRQLTLPLQFPLSLDELVRRIVALKWTMTDEHRAELRRILAARYPEFGDAASRSPLTEPAAVLTRGNELW